MEWTKEETAKYQEWARRHNALQCAIYSLMSLGCSRQSIMEYTEQFIQDGLYDIEGLTDEYIAANEKPFAGGVTESGEKVIAYMVKIKRENDCIDVLVGASCPEEAAAIAGALGLGEVLWERPLSKFWGMTTKR